jgi:hypothetical protein
MRHDITFPLYVEIDQIFNLACPAAPIYYQFHPVQMTKTSRAWRDQHAGAGQAAEGEDPASLDQRRVWRPYGSSAARELPWQRQPARSARLLRRGQKVRRDPVLRLSSTARRADPGRPDLQHLRAPDAAERRPRRLQLHRPGAPGRADHGLWRRPPDAVLLLRRRPDRGTAQADGDRRRRDRPDQPRQSPRGPGPRTRQADRWHDRIEIQDPVPSRCRPTTRASGSRTSPRRGGCWIGSPRCRSRKGWAGPSPISRNGCGRPSEVRLRRKRSARGRRRPAAPDPLPRRRVSRGPR